MSYFEVVAKCGHVGKGYYIPISFAITAKNRSDAAKVTRNKARVKHDRPDAIIAVNRLTKEEYEELKRQNEADPYLNCANIQQQRGIEGLEVRIKVDEYQINRRERKYAKEKCIEYKLKKAKILDKQKKDEMREFYIDGIQFVCGTSE